MVGFKFCSFTCSELLLILLSGYHAHNLVKPRRLEVQNCQDKRCKDVKNLDTKIPLLY